MILSRSGLAPKSALPPQTAAVGHRHLINSARSCLVVGLGLALTACAFPRKDYTFLPDHSVITVTHDGSVYKANAPDCSTLMQRSHHNKVDDLRKPIGFGCSTYTNLAAQLARPEDLVRAKAYRGQSPDAAAAAITRYRENKVTPLRETRSTDVGE